MRKSLYIHVPFCRKKCIYCDFYSEPYKESLASTYVDTLLEQIRSLDDDFYTVYIGGGTPTVLDIALWRKLLQQLRKISRKAKEFTVEANPESIDSDKLKLFYNEGVNRLSIGIQSFSQESLKKLGRVHSVKQAIDSVILAKNEGFSNINIDLIFGIWRQTLPSWKKDLQQAVNLGVRHISTYGLTIERRTPLSRDIKTGRIKLLKDKIVALMYELCMDRLSKKGFLHYEVSNFSKEGCQCKHNLHYWDNGAYVGLGPSAVSYLDGERAKSIADLAMYIKKVKKKESPVVFKERLSPVKKAKESAILKIRTKEGLNFKDFKNRTGFDFIDFERDSLSSLLRQGFLKYKTKNNEKVGISLTKKGFLFSDTVSVALL